MYTNNDNGSKGWALGFGLLAGIAIGYYLNSNEGRAARRKAQVRFDEYGNQVSTRATEISGQAREKGQEYLETAKTKGQEYLDTAKTQLESGKEWANTTATNVKSSINETGTSVKTKATDSANSVADSFKRGMDKAKHNIDDKADKIEKVVEG